MDPRTRPAQAMQHTREEIERIQALYARRRRRVNGMFFAWFIIGGGALFLARRDGSVGWIPLATVDAIWLGLFAAYLFTWFASSRCPACGKFLWFPIRPPCPRCGIPLR